MDWLPLVFLGLAILISLPTVAWAAGALYYDVGRTGTVGWILAVGWLAFVTALFLFWHPAWKPFAALWVAIVLLLIWWLRQRPSHDRNWDPNYSRLPRVELQGDVVTVFDVRNTQYANDREPEPRFETRTFRLSNLRGADALILYWGSPWMSHPMIVFDFGSDGRVCVSIEVRYRRDQAYDFLRSLFRQQEIMYVVSDERDAILKRASLENHDLYLYRLNTDPILIRQVFFEYVGQINDVYARPRWYHGLTTNCTTSIYAQGRARMKWDWRIVFNGKLDQMLYERAVLDRRLSFEDLKRQSRINEIVTAAPADGFGDAVRRQLGGYHAP